MPPRPCLPHTPSRRRALKAGLVLAAVCARPVRACEVQAEFLRVVHPWTRATAPGADSAVLGMTIDQVTKDDRLVAVQTPVANGAVLVQDGQSGPLDLPLPAGHETVLAEQGTQVRLTGLQVQLQAGRTYPLTLHFRHSGVVLAQLSVDFTRLG